MKKHLLCLLAVVAACLLLVSCGDDSSSSDDDDNGGTGTDTDGGKDTEKPGTGEIGDYCEEREDCKSNYCAAWTSIPADTDGVCEEGLPKGQIRLMGTLSDFFTHEPIPNAEIHIAGAVTASVAPENAYKSSPVKATTDKDGRYKIDAGKELTGLALGIVTLFKNDKYYLTLTGMVQQELEDGDSTYYPPGPRGRDMMAVPANKLKELSGMLGKADSSIAPYLPLGEKGGAIARARYVETGEGVPGVKVVSKNANSKALIYYLNEAENAFTKNTETSSNGLFIVIAPSIGEKFDGQRGDEVISQRPATLGSAKMAAYTNTLHIHTKDDPGYKGE